MQILPTMEYKTLCIHTLTRKGFPNIAYIAAKIKKIYKYCKTTKTKPAIYEMKQYNNVRDNKYK